MNHIRLYLLLFVLALGSFGAHAQQSNYRFGLHITPNYSWVSPETRLLNRSQGGVGFAYGLMVERSIGNGNYFFSTGLSVNQLQYSSTIDSALYKLPNGTTSFFANPNYEYRVQYFELPLTMKMRTNQMGSVRIYGQFGLATAVAFQAKARVNNTPAVFDPEEYFFVNQVEDYKPTESLRTDDRVNAFRASILIGAGVEYLLSGNTHLVFGLRLDNPFTDAYRGDKLNGRTSMTGLQVGIIF
jgi:hypothetical protein